MGTAALSVQDRRVAVTFGALLTVLCMGVSTLAGYGALHGSHRNLDDVILVALMMTGALALARLAVLCAMATWDVLLAPSEIEPLTALHATAFHAGRPTSKGHNRLAGWLLTLAALLGPASASASTPNTTMSISLDASSASDAQHDPFFTLEASSAPKSETASAEEGAPPKQSASRPLQDCEAIPEPGWTIPSAASPLACRVLGGGHDVATPVVTHVVQRGETMWGIAASYLPRSAGNAQIATSLHAWIKANPLTLAHPDLIQVGDTLIVPTK